MKKFISKVKKATKDFFTNKSAFSLVELIVVIAIMAVMAAVLAPALLGYVERSRAQKDDSAMDEVVESVQLTISNYDVFDEVYEYCVPNNYTTYTDSSGIYGNQIIDEEYWAPDGLGPAVTITFNPKNRKYNINEGIVNDMTFGNGSVAEKRTAEGVQQCYLYEMGQARLCSSVKQIIGDSVKVRSATYKNSSFTVFIRFKIVDGIRQADVYGQFNGTNLHEGSPAAIGSNTSSYDEENKPISTTPNGGQQNNSFTNTDLSDSGSLGGFSPNKPLPAYRQCKNGHTFDETNPVLAERCICTVCFAVEHKFYKTGTIMKCERCGYVKEHECNGNPCPLCGAIPFTVTAENRHKVGFTGEENEKLVIPEMFVDTDCQRYRVAAIGYRAFYGCESLTSINIPDSVTSIDMEAFYRCSSLTSVNIPDGVTSIGHGVFCGCRSLSSINIPDSVTSIDKWAFCNCSSLTSINIPDGVTRIENSAFYGCESLTSINIPDGVTSIGMEAFYGCSSLASVNIPDGVTDIALAAFNGCSSLTSINIPDGVTSIKGQAFCNTGLTEIVIPDATNGIGDQAFTGCYKLTDVTILKGKVGVRAFRTEWGSVLKNLTLGNEVTYLDSWCFEFNRDLKNIYYLGTIDEWKTLMSKSSSSWNLVTGNYTIHCTDGCLNKNGTVKTDCVH